MNIIRFNVGDILILKKKHPCSSDAFKVLRCGSDVKILCTGCQREMLLQREKLEKSIKKIITQNDADSKEI